MTPPAPSENPSTVIYETTVTAVGEQVPAFVSAGILILFAETAPAELHAISVLHSATVQESGPHPGDTVELGNTQIPVLAVGAVVHDNLLNLGHMDLKSDGRADAKLPGDVCVPTDSLVELQVGDTIRIVRPAAGHAETGEQS